MLFRRERYSYLIRPLLVLMDLLIINGVLFFVYDHEFLNIYFSSYISVFWIISSLFIGFYKVHRTTKIYHLFALLALQFSILFLGYFTYFALFREGEIVNNQTYIFTSIVISISIFKFLSFYALKKYRLKGMNYRNVVLIGLDETSKKVTNLFINRADLGYRYFGFFSNKKNNHHKYLGTLEESFDYILEKQIDEIYCVISVLNKEQVKRFTKFANEHSLIIKLIPDSNELYSKSVNAEYYDNTLILNVKRLPLEISENRFAKRFFDIAFSFFVLVFIMSWLAPILWVLIKLESKGSILFKQEREGFGGYHFTCYKFRSMKLNSQSDEIHATKNDERITKMGAFMRKTSLDELPQFFNVLKGDMSVVGPRPHMKNLSREYQKEIDNYMERHTVRPGITGLAQVSGYRGEVKKRSDIKNRIRLDVFYIENWSFFLDIKIILQTIFNVFKGEEKAY